MVILRQATIFDHGKILDLGVKWFEETNIEFIPRICPYTGIWIADMIANHLVIIGELEDRIIGTLMVRFGFMPWNNEEQILIGEALMTDKEYRFSCIGEKLIEVIKEFADNAGLPLLMGHISGKDIGSKNKWFKVKGFIDAGSNFMYKGA